MLGFELCVAHATAGASPSDAGAPPPLRVAGPAGMEVEDPDVGGPALSSDVRPEAGRSTRHDPTAVRAVGPDGRLRCP